jgi:hypothetical protein
MINHLSWECYNCKNTFSSLLNSSQKGNMSFFQVDLIENDSILMSNYWEQRFVKFQGLTPPPPLNSSYCKNCVDQMPGQFNCFEKEENYTFQQSGYTCWNSEKIQKFERDCGTCWNCQNQLIMKSLFNHSHKKSNYFYLIWSPHLASRSFPDPLNPQVFICQQKSNFFQDNQQQQQQPSRICQECFEAEKTWIPNEGPIECPLCNKKYQRYIFHWADQPVQSGCECLCQSVNEQIIIDSLIDPNEYKWVGLGCRDHPILILRNHFAVNVFKSYSNWNISNDSIKLMIRKLCV